MDRNTIALSLNINPRLLENESLRRCTLSECRGACCLYGVWVDLKEAEDILQHQELILPEMPEGSKEPAEWFTGEQDEDGFSPSKRVIHSAVIEQPAHYGGTACIFWRADARCALQVAAQKAGLHPWRFKPFYCILHPLDLDDEGRITLDDAQPLSEEPGSCLRPANSPRPLVDTFEEELRYFLGDRRYERLRALCSQ